MRKLYVLLFLAISSLSVNAATVADTIADNKLPTPNVERLFYLQRDPNINTVVYELNLDKKDEPDTDAPVHPYWIRYTEKGEKAELNWIQRKFAYGVKSKHLGDGKYDIRFVSYNKIPFTLMKGSDGKYHIFVTISKRQAILKRVFIRIKGGSFWSPNVIYMELKGIDTATGKEIFERFKP